jgi:hypothetical protein
MKKGFEDAKQNYLFPGVFYKIELSQPELRFAVEKPMPLLILFKVSRVI